MQIHLDAVGGVEMCPETAIEDPKARLDIQAGCQVMDGDTALGYARTRDEDPRGAARLDPEGAVRVPCIGDPESVALVELRENCADRGRLPGERQLLGVEGALDPPRRLGVGGT